MVSKLGRSSFVMLAAFVIAAACDYAFGAGMSWVLPPSEYGALSVSLSYFLLLSLFVASGFPMSIARALAERDRPPRGILRTAIMGNLVVAVTVVTLFLGLTFYGPLSPGPGYGRLVFAVAAATILLSVGTTMQFALQGRMAFTSFALLHASRSMNKLFVGAALVALGFGLAGAVGGLVAGGAFLIIATAWLWRRRAAHDPAGPPLTRDEKRQFYVDTWQLFLGSVALTLLLNLDLLAVKYLTPALDSNVFAAHYQSASVLTKAPLWAVIAGMSVFFPIMSRAAVRDPEAARALVARVVRWTLLAIGPITAVLVFFPRQALALMFPSAYAEAAGAVAVSAVAMGALAICFVLTRALQAAGYARGPGAFLAVAAALQVALLAAFVPRLGILGAALATAIACSAGALLAVGAAVPTFRIHVQPMHGVRFAVALALLVAVIAAIAPTNRIATLLSIAAGTSAYVVALFLLGLVTPAERQALARAIPGARGASHDGSEPTAPEG